MTTLRGYSSSESAGLPAGDAVSNQQPAPNLSQRVDWPIGFDDAMAGRRYRLTPADLLERAGAPDIQAYMLGYRAGELERAKGGADALRTD
jgi:hypothetical protein